MLKLSAIAASMLLVAIGCAFVEDSASSDKIETKQIESASHKPVKSKIDEKIPERAGFAYEKLGDGYHVLVSDIKLPFSLIIDPTHPDQWANRYEDLDTEAMKVTNFTAGDDLDYVFRKAEGERIIYDIHFGKIGFSCKAILTKTKEPIVINDFKWDKKG
jgi:hypothetical protein